MGRRADLATSGTALDAAGHPLHAPYSKCGPLTSSIDTTLELEMQALDLLGLNLHLEKTPR